MKKPYALVVKAGIITSVLCAILLTQACVKSSTSPTNQPKMTAKVNGNSFSADCSANYSNGRLMLVSITIGSPVKEFNIYLGVTAAGTIALNTNTGAIGTGNTGVYAEGPSASSLTDYATDSTHTGTMVITKFDVAAKKVSGTFSFNAIQISPNTGTGTVSITDGAFTDVTWQ